MINTCIVCKTSFVGKVYNAITCDVDCRRVYINNKRRERYLQFAEKRMVILKRNKDRRIRLKSNPVWLEENRERDRKKRALYMADPERRHRVNVKNNDRRRLKRLSDDQWRERENNRRKNPIVRAANRRRSKARYLALRFNEDWRKSQNEKSNHYRKIRRATDSDYRDKMNQQSRLRQRKLRSDSQYLKNVNSYKRTIYYRNANCLRRTGSKFFKLLKLQHVIQNENIQEIVSGGTPA